MAVPVRRLGQAGLIVMMSAAALASPFSVSARSTHDVVHYDRQHIATLKDGSELYMETLETRGHHSRELKSVRDWKAYAEETTLQVTTSQAAAGYYDYWYWHTAGCKLTVVSAIGRIYYYQVTHDWDSSRYLDGSVTYPYIAADLSTDEAWATWFMWNLTAHSTKGPYVVSYTYLPPGGRYPYQEYVVGNYQIGHGVTTPWGSIITEYQAGWLKLFYGPAGGATCYRS